MVSKLEAKYPEETVPCPPPSRGRPTSFFRANPFLARYETVHSRGFLRSIETAIRRSLFQGAFSLSREQRQEVGFNPKRFPSGCQLVRLQAEIQNQKDKNLLSFFRDNVRINPRFQEVADTLRSMDLTDSTKAEKIRKWMKENPLILNTLTRNFSFSVRNLRTFPVELLEQDNLSAEFLQIVFKRACKIGLLEFVQKAIDNPRFSNAEALGIDLIEASSKKGGVYSVEIIINSPKFRNISNADLGEAFTRAAEAGLVRNIEILIGCGRYREIPDFSLEIAFDEAVSKQHFGVVKAILSSERSGEIPVGFLISALKAAREHGSPEDLKFIAEFILSADFDSKE